MPSKGFLTMDIMLDLETLSSAPDAAIVAIGARTFSSDGLMPQDESQEFYVAVSPQSAQDAGGAVSASTVQWWAMQSEEARAALNDARAVPVAEALAAFAGFCARFDRPRIWGNGAGFDNVVLRSAYERLGYKAPWKFPDDRCYRTLKNLRPDVPFVRRGVAHHALADAADQARHAEAIFGALRGV
jgi:exodeoxyribonuclease VIII